MSVVISPATTTSPVVISVSHATRPFGSPPMTASRTESEIWSAILSGWPSVTDSDVKENERCAMAAKRTYESSRLFRRGLAAHQLLDEVGERDAPEHRADPIRDRQLEPEPLRHPLQRGCGRQALDHHPDLLHRLGRRRALRDQLAGSPISPRRGPAGHDQVAHP